MADTSYKLVPAGENIRALDDFYSSLQILADPRYNLEPAGDTTVLFKDKKMMYRIEVLQKINPDYKERILYMLDVMLKDAQNNSLADRLA